MNISKSRAESRIRKSGLKQGMTALALALAVAFGTLPAQAQEQPVQISIPSQPLSKALLQLGEQASLQIFFAQDLVDGYQAPALSGNLPPEEALRRLLAGTGIAFRRNGNNVSLSRVADAETAVLDTVEVRGSFEGGLLGTYAGGQMARGGSLGILGTSDTMDTPFSMTNYTSAMIEDQQARTLADIVVNDASVRTTTAPAGFGEDFQIRGWSVGSGEVGFNGLYSLVSSSRIPVQIIERVEVLKGPGTLMRGIPPNGSIGGSINMRSKRAGNEPLTRLTTSYVSSKNLSAHMDVGRRFGEAKEWGVRFNGVLKGGEASIKGGKQNLGLAALGLDYTGERLRWSMDAIYLDDTVEDFRSQIGFLNDVTEMPAAPDGDIGFYPGTRLTQRDSTVASRLEYDLTDRITAHVAVGYRDGKARQIFPVNPERSDAEGNFRVASTFYDSYSETWNTDAGLSAVFNTGAIGHRLALGATRLTQESGNAYSAIANDPGEWSNIYDPVPLPAGPTQRLEPKRSSEKTLTSIVIADTMSFAEDRVLLTLGARKQTVDTENYNTTTGARTSGYKASAISPVAGLVVKPTENVSLYANYTAGLSAGRVVGAGYRNTGEVLDPYKTKQYEAGVKVDWGSLMTTVSVYQMARPAGQEEFYPDGTKSYGYFGEQRNRGLEITAYGELQPGLRMFASASFIDGKLTKTQNGVNEGNRAPGVPSSMYNLGLDWDTPWVNGLSLNGRMIRTSSMYLDNANTRRLPGVTRFDVGARYSTVIAGKPVVLRANVENLTDRKYWLASGTYATNAAGRTFVLSATVDF